MTRGINLHILANEPGAGKARESLIKAGEWDEHAGTGDEKAYYVEVKATCSTTLKVLARNVREAKEKAVLEAEEIEDFEHFEDFEAFDIRRVKGDT